MNKELNVIETIPFNHSDIERQVIVEEEQKLLLERYIQVYLTEHSNYADGDVFNRYLVGRIMSQGMKYEMDKATVYARAAMGDLNEADLYIQIKDKYSQARQKEILSIFQEGKSNGSEHEVNKSMNDKIDTYRH